MNAPLPFSPVSALSARFVFFQASLSTAVIILIEPILHPFLSLEIVIDFKRTGKPAWLWPSRTRVLTSHSICTLNSVVEEKKRNVLTVSSIGDFHSFLRGFCPPKNIHGFCVICLGGWQWQCGIIIDSPVHSAMLVLPYFAMGCLWSLWLRDKTCVW